MIERFQRFSAAIFEITRHWHKIAADEMERYGLKGAHAVYLIALSHHSQGVTAAELCDLCARDKADVSRMVLLMEEKGLVRRDGRMYRSKIYLTDEGLAAAEHVRQRASKAVELGGTGITEAERSQFYDTLERIASNLQIISEEGLPGY